MKTTATALLWSACWLGQGGQQSIRRDSTLHQAVDSTLTRVVDVTHDARPDTIILRVQGESLAHPLRWMLEIHSNAQIIFRHVSVDSAIDVNFGDSNFSPGRDRQQAKELYYFSTLLRRLVEPEHIQPNRYSMFNPAAPNGPYKDVPVELRKIGVNDARLIAAAVEGVVARLKAGAMILNVPISPAQNDFPRIYVPEVGRFVIFHKW